MIAARKIPFFNFFLRRWLAVILRRRFHNIYLLGVESLAAIDNARPVVGCVNHTNWWDGFVLYVLSHRRLPHDIYLAMEERNLRRYRFFTWMGVFGIDLSDPRAALPGVRYALRLLSSALEAPRLIWIFAQGKLLPSQTAIEVKPGALFLAKCSGAQILPLVLRYEWLAESRPSIFIQVGQILASDTTPDELAAILNQLFVRIDAALDPASVHQHETLFPERMSMNKRWDHVVHLLSRRHQAFDKYNR